MTTRRFTEQRGLLDNVIRSVRMDWDQPRSLYLSGPCGIEASADCAGIRQRITKLADASPAFEAVARRREAKAAAADEERHPVTARDNYFMAAIRWGASQWPIDEANAQNRSMKVLGGPKRLVVYQDSGTRSATCRRRTSDRSRRR